MPESGKCALCDATILWANSEAGHVLVVDAEPSPQGDIIIKDGVGHVTTGDLWEQFHGGTRYRQHAATCPRQKKGKKK